MNGLEEIDVVSLMEVKGGCDALLELKCPLGSAVRCEVQGSGEIRCEVKGSGVIVSPTEPSKDDIK